MTGSGTAQDPYKPETWAEVLSCTTSDSVYVDFPVTLTPTSDTEVKVRKVYLLEDGSVVQNPKTSEISTYYENTFVFDMNDYYPGGIESAITLKGHINGRGATIKNASYRGSDKCFETGASLKQCLDFINCRGELSNGFFIGTVNPPSSGTTLFRLCRFSGKVVGIGNNTPYFSWIGRYAYFDQCSFNVEADGAMLDYALYKRCAINVIIPGNQGSGYLQLDNSYLTGRINRLQMQRISSSYFVGDSIIDCYVNGVVWDSGTPQHLMINSDKVASGVTIPSKLTPGTTEQLKDANWLSSQGFPIQT